jgi:heme/copper-type cytochrome/quinol oxidase subunit 1
MVGGSIFAFFAGIYYWWPKMFGRMVVERWGRGFVRSPLYTRMIYGQWIAK